MSILRIMIIVWKWNEFEGFKKVFRIKGQPNDLILAIKDSARRNDIEKEIQHQLQNEEEDKEKRFFIFLHREAHFSNEDIHTFLNFSDKENILKGKVKCFLFSGGRDFIYYSVGNEGLLSQSGRFMFDPDYQDDFGDRKKVKVYEEINGGEDKIILPKHFNIVWDYYHYEFYDKVNDLHVDIMSSFVNLSDTSVNVEKRSLFFWKEHIRSKSFLWKRLGSFLGIYSEEELNKIKLEHLENRRAVEKNELEAEEVMEKQSLVFDDVTVNLQENTEAKLQYDKIHYYLRPLFEEIDSVGFIDQSYSLQDINTAFNKLLFTITPTHITKQHT